MTEHRDIIDVRLPEKPPERVPLPGSKTWNDRVFWMLIVAIIFTLAMLSVGAFA